MANVWTDRDTNAFSVMCGAPINGTSGPTQSFFGTEPGPGLTGVMVRLGEFKIHRWL